MKARPLPELVLFLVAAVAALAMLLAATFCRPQETPEPPPPSVTAAPAPATATATATTTVGAPTVVVPSVTPGPTASPPDYTRQPTPLPAIPTVAPPTATPPPTVTPIALRGRVWVAPGDTLWGIACREYAGIPLRPGANPLTPCTCWPGLWLANARIRDARLILPRWRLDVPVMCIQAPLR